MGVVLRGVSLNSMRLMRVELVDGFGAASV